MNQLNKLKDEFIEKEVKSNRKQIEEYCFERNISLDVDLQDAIDNYTRASMRKMKHELSDKSFQLGKEERDRDWEKLELKPIKFTGEEMPDEAQWKMGYNMATVKLEAKKEQLKNLINK